MTKYGFCRILSCVFFIAIASHSRGQNLKESYEYLDNVAAMGGVSCAVHLGANQCRNGKRCTRMMNIVRGLKDQNDVVRSHAAIDFHAARLASTHNANCLTSLLGGNAGAVISNVEILAEAGLQAISNAIGEPSANGIRRCSIETTYPGFEGYYLDFYDVTTKDDRGHKVVDSVQLTKTDDGRRLKVWRIEGNSIIADHSSIGDGFNLDFAGGAEPKKGNNVVYFDNVQLLRHKDNKNLDLWSIDGNAIEVVNNSNYRKYYLDFNAGDPKNDDIPGITYIDDIWVTKRNNEKPIEIWRVDCS